MTSLPGGIADKDGNRYEHWWTACRIADVLEGRASGIRLEPAGDLGEGVEFAVQEPGVVWVEQTKSDTRHWTLNRLREQRVLAAMLGHLRHGRHYRLIVAGRAEDLETLSARARQAASLADYELLLTGPLRNVLALLAEWWGSSAGDTLALLRLVTVESHPAESLRRLVDATYRRLVTAEPEVVVAALRGWYEDHLGGPELTGPSIWAFLEKHFERRHLPGDQTTLTHLRNTVARAERRMIDGEPACGFVPRTDTAELIERLQADDGHQIIVVDGPAGCGKSAVVTAAGAQLSSLGWFAAAIRMDALDPSTRSAHRLGEAFDLGESPAVLLAGSADGKPALLIIDQLDAVSLYSGRMPDAFDAVRDVLEQLTGCPNVKVVLVVRSVDLRGDPRLSRLTRDQKRVEQLTVGLLARDDVLDALRAAEMSPPQSERTVELLRTPIHLAVYCRLSDEARLVSYEQLTDLYERYTDDLRVTLERTRPAFRWADIVGPLINHMSEHEVLSVPDSILDNVPILDVNTLISAGVLIRDGRQVSFFHESYFDYLFARDFTRSGGDLAQFLVTSGQHLFRRAQTRQVLEHLAMTDRTRFRATVVTLIGSGMIRSHLLDIAHQVLTVIPNPSIDDWNALERFAWDDGPIALKILHLLSLPAWFDASDDGGRWERYLADPERCDRAFNTLVVVARLRGVRVAELVRPHLGSNDPWARRWRVLVGFSFAPGLADLVVDSVTAGEFDDFTDFWQVFMHSTADLSDQARVLGAFLRRATIRARLDGSSDPFESKHLADRSSTATDAVTRIAAGAPAAYLEQVLPFVLDIARVNHLDRGAGDLPVSARWGMRMRDRDLAVHDVLFTGIDRALRQIAASTPAELDRFLGPLLEAAVADLRFLACRALTVAARPDDAIEWLLGDPRNLELGWSGDRDASRDLIETCSNTCNDGVYATLERTLLSYTPHWETLPDRQRFLGFSQYELLSRLDEDRRSSATIARLQELDRQFPGGPPKALRQPNNVTAVRSPIPDETIITMSDDEWRDALRKYADAGLTLHDHPVVGAIGALTQSLHERSQHEPERFARFVLTLDAGYPAAATGAVLRVVGGGVIPVELLATLCEHAHAMHGSELDRTICHTIQQTKETTSTLVNLLTDIARDPDPATNELSRTMTGPGIDGLLNDGVNTTRGAAALAIANVIYRQPDHVDTLLPVVRTLAQDPHLGVRSCAADAVSALLNHRPHDALDLALMLLEPDITVLGARTSEQLLIYATVRDRDRFAPIITTGLQAGEPVATRAGRVWAVAALNDALSQQLPDSVTGLNAHARRGAAEILAMHPSHVADELAVLFNDDDADVRSAAARAMRALDTVPTTDRDDFVTSFIHSTSFAEQPDDLLDTLDEAPHLTSIAAFEGCEKLVAIAGPALGDLTSRHGRYGPTITNITLRLYREGNPELRTRCLNLFDRLVEHNALAIGDLLDDDR